MSGDHTVEALESAVDELAERMDADERFVIIVSDANFRRYGISTHEISSTMRKHEEVKAFFLALASFGDEAERIIDSLQPGHGFAPQASELFLYVS